MLRTYLIGDLLTATSLVQGLSLSYCAVNSYLDVEATLRFIKSQVKLVPSRSSHAQAKSITDQRKNADSTASKPREAPRRRRAQLRHKSRYSPYRTRNRQVPSKVHPSISLWRLRKVTSRHPSRLTTGCKTTSGGSSWQCHIAAQPVKSPLKSRDAAPA